MTHKATLGGDARGNLTRLDNTLANLPERAHTAAEQLDNLLQQMESAKQEIGKPFPQEAELAAKSARLSELDAMLNIDANRTTQEKQPEKDTPPAKRPSVLEVLKVPCKSGDREGAPVPKRDKEAR
jgi:chromosome segregation ATPase